MTYSTPSPGAAVFARLQNQQEGRAFEAQLQQQARQYTAANRFRSLAAAAAENAIQTRLARLNAVLR